jgi:hypothetical protein
MDRNQLHKLNRGEARNSGCSIGFRLSMLLLFMLLTWPLIGQHFAASASPGGEKALPFRYLWKNHSWLSVGMAGYREVSEQDLFRVRWINPSGADYNTTVEKQAITQSGIMPLVSFSAGIQRIVPILKHRVVPLHGELSASIFFQKVVAPSAFSNQFSAPDHYDVHYRNLPLLFSGSLRAGLWIGELVSLGGAWGMYMLRINTNDDRIMQRKGGMNEMLFSPYAQVWIPLENTMMKRWSARLVFSPINLHQPEAPFRGYDAELFLLRVSTEKSGRVFGCFVRTVQYLQLPEIIDDVDYVLHHDRQVLFGITFGGGGLNNNKGR